MANKLWKALQGVSTPRHEATLRALLDRATQRTDYHDASFFGVPVEDLGGGWFMCAECVDAVEATPGVCRCPGCDRGLVATGTLLTWPDASLLVVDWGGATAVRVQARGHDFYRVPGHRGWTRAADGTGSVPEDAWVLALAAGVLGEQALRRDAIDPAKLFEHFPLKLEDGYFCNDGFADYVAEAPLDELATMAAHIRDGFTFVPGGTWSPDWLSGDRRAGSPLQLLEPVLERMKALHPPTHLRWAARLLGHVACDEDVYVHDALAMSQNLAAELVGDLVGASMEGDDLEALVVSTERAVRSGAGVSWSVDLFGLLLHLLEGPLDDAQRARVIEALVRFSDADALEAYLDSEMVTQADLAVYADRITAMPDAPDELVARLRAA